MSKLPNLRIHSVLLALFVATPALCHDDAPYFINVDRIVEIARAAVHDAYPDIDQDDLVLEDQSIDAFCRYSESPESPTTSEADAEPCHVQIEFDLKSTHSAIRYLSEDGDCMIAEGSNSMMVLVRSNGSAKAHSGWGTNERPVECTEEFYEQLERQR